MGRLVKILRNRNVVIIYVIITLAFIIHYIFKQRETIWQILMTAHFNLLIFALAFLCINYFLYSYATHSIFQKLGASLTIWQTLQIIFISRLGVYLPGRIWYASNFYIFSRKLNIPSIIIGQTFVLDNILLFVTGGALSLPILLPFLPPYARAGIVIVFLLLFLCLHPRILHLMISFFPYVTKRLQELEYFSRLSGGFYLKLILLFFILWLFAGAKLFFCILSTSNIGYEDFYVVLSSSAVSQLSGLLAVFAPAGIGVYEGIGTIILSKVIPLQNALLAIIISRLMQATVDLGLGISAFYFLNSRKA